MFDLQPGQLVMIQAIMAWFFAVCLFIIVCVLLWDAFRGDDE